MDTELQKYRATFESADAEIKALEESNETMAEKLKKLQTESAIKIGRASCRERVSSPV